MNGKMISSAVCTCLAALCFIISSCGGGGSDWLKSIWVETDVIVADIDGDGLADVLTIAMLNRQGYLTVYRQTGPGAFAAPESYNVGTYPWRMAARDVNGDGLPDLVITDPDAQAVWLLLQESLNRGKFLTPQKIAAGITTYDAAVADLNGDGLPDIAIANALVSSNRLMLLYNNPSSPGTFLPPVDFTLPGGPLHVAAGDLNGDGLDDLPTWLYLSKNSDYSPNGSLAVLMQKNDGSLNAATTSLAPQSGLNVNRLAIGDFNGDGRKDLFIFFTPFSADYAAKFTVLLQGVAPGSYAAPVDTSLAGVRGIDGASVADLNGDGLPDVAVAGFYPEGSPSVVRSRLNVFTQSGSGAFVLAGVYDMPVAVSCVSAGDIDGDGRNDLVVFGENNQCMVLIHSHTAPGTFGAPHLLP